VEHFENIEECIDDFLRNLGYVPPELLYSKIGELFQDIRYECRKGKIKLENQNTQFTQ